MAHYPVSSALVTGERARQTLDVLMSTPMMTRDIVMQKMAGVHYLINILYIPMATAAVSPRVIRYRNTGAGTRLTPALSMTVYAAMQTDHVILQPA